MRATWEESDCLSYSIAIESEADGVITMVERWRNEAALLAYLSTPTMREFRTAIKSAIFSLDARIYDVAGDRPLPSPYRDWLNHPDPSGPRLVGGAA